MEYNKINNVIIHGINTNDYPDFSDAYIEYADYDEKPMTEEQLDRLNKDTDYVYECIIKELF